MNPFATKHENKFKEEFNLAKKALSDQPGTVNWSYLDYECFRYTAPDICLIFYPHKTSAGNIHVRVRNQHSKNSRLAEILMRKLDAYAGNNCTFTRKH